MASANKEPEAPKLSKYEQQLMEVFGVAQAQEEKKEESKVSIPMLDLSIISGGQG